MIILRIGHEATMLTEMIFVPRQEPFVCENCGTAVDPLPRGSYRNHCPACLWSKHVDHVGPGDRASGCGGLMEAMALDQRSGRGWMVHHQCVRCGKTIVNVCAPDDDVVGLSKRIVQP